MKPFPCAAAAALVLAAASAASAQPGVVVSLPVDRPVTIRGVEVACTGIGQTKDDPNWRAYPVRVEFSDHDNAYLGGGEITVFAARKPVLSVRCDAPWILLKPAAGAYTVEGRVPGAQAKPRSARFQPPAHGQMRLVLQFPEL